MAMCFLSNSNMLKTFLFSAFSDPHDKNLEGQSEIRTEDYKNECQDRLLIEKVEQIMFELQNQYKAARLDQIKFKKVKNLKVKTWTKKDWCGNFRVFLFMVSLIALLYLHLYLLSGSFGFFYPLLIILTMDCLFLFLSFVICSYFWSYHSFSNENWWFLVIGVFPASLAIFIIIIIVYFCILWNDVP